MRQAVLRARLWLVLLTVWVASPALGQPGDDLPPPTETLRQWLVGGDVESRLRAVGWLAQDGSPSAIEALELAALDPAPDVRRLALDALGPRPISADVFAHALDDADPTVRIAALSAAADIPDDEARVAVVIEALDDDDASVRIHAAETLLARVPVEAWPACTELVVRWRRAGDATPPDPSELQATAALVYARTTSASACGLTEDEYTGVAEQARRHGTFLAAPELALAQRAWRGRLDEMRYRMLELEDSATFTQETVCLEPLRIQYGDFFALAVEAEQRIDVAMSSDPGDAAMSRSVLSLLDTLERFLTDTETCFADPDAFQPYAYANPYTPYTHILRPVHTYLHAGFEAIYDDHFLALRDDVETLRVTDQMGERIVARGQWTSHPWPLDEPLTVDLNETVLRLRGELAGELFNGESQLSGVTGWTDLFLDLPLTRNHHLFAVAEGGYDRGWLDRGLPWRLIMPAGWFRSLAGVSIDVRDSDVPTLSIAAGFEGQLYQQPDGLSPTRALSGDSPSLGISPAWVPLDAEDADRLTGDARARWAFVRERDGGLFADAGYRVHGYLHGTPSLSDTLVPFNRDPFNHHLRTEVGAWFGDYDIFVIAQLGATSSFYPDPTDASTVTFSGRAYAELADATRNGTGGRLWADVWRRVDDAPGIGDALAHSGVRAGASLWENEDVGIVELDVATHFEHVARAVLPPDRLLDGELLRGGLTMALNFAFDEAPTFSLAWMLLAEKNQRRDPAYLQTLDGVDDRAILRNVVMLNMVLAFDGHSLDLLDARSPEWGFDQVRHSAIPALWWLEP